MRAPFGRAANAGAKPGREPAMQKPFPELINEPGEDGAGAEPADLPTSPPRRLAVGLLSNAGSALSRPRPRLRPPAARSSAQRELLRQGQPAARAPLRAGPGAPGPPAAARPRPAGRPRRGSWGGGRSGSYLLPPLRPRALATRAPSSSGRWGGAPGRLRRPPAAAFRHRGPPTRPAAGPGCRNAKPTSRLRRLLPMKSPAAGALHAAARSGPASRPAPRPPPPQRHRHRPGRGPQASRSAAPRPPPAPLLDSGEEGRRRQAGALRPGGVGRAAAEPGNRGRRGKERGAACLSCAWASSHLASPSAKRLC